MADIRVRMFFRQPVANVYKAWTEPDLLKLWLASKANVEPKVGGTYELYWDPGKPDSNSTKGCRITGLVPNQRIAFDWRGPDHLAETMNQPPLTRVEVRFERAEGGARMHFLHFGFGDGPDWEKALRWQTRAWQVAFERLQTLLA